MAAIVLGSGSEQLKIEGDALRIDPLAVQIGKEHRAKIHEFKIVEGPKDDVRISELPQSMRDIASMVLTMLTVETDYGLPAFEWVHLVPAIQSWVLIDMNTPINAGTKIGWTISNNRIVVSGLVPLVKELPIGSDLEVNGWVVGTVIGSKLGLLTPWAMRKAGK